MKILFVCYCTWIHLLFSVVFIFLLLFSVFLPRFLVFLQIHLHSIVIFFLFHFIPLYTYIFSFHAYLLAPVASCFFHILRPIHPHVPVLRIGLYSPRCTHGFIGRPLCLLWRGGGGLTSTGSIMPRAAFETANVRTTSYCHA